MAIPVISDIVNFFRSVISWFLDLLPNPVKFLLFIFIVMSVVSSLVPLLLGTLGYHCDADNHLYKIRTTDFVSNVKLLRLADQLEDRYDNVQNKTIKSLPLFLGVEVCTNTTIADCNNCTFERLSAGLEKNCKSDGYRLETITLNPLCRFGCAPPEDFFYNVTANYFQCYTGNCSDTDALKAQFDEEILENEGNPITIPTDRDKKYNWRNILKVSCESGKSRWTMFYELDLFDPRLWGMLFLLAAVLFIRGFKA